VLASLVSLLLAPPVGMYAQKRFTTQTPADNMSISDVQHMGRFGSSSYFVRTAYL
jgi:hypothetical protein